MDQRLKQLRKELNLTQQEFADRLGVSRGNIASYEAGKSNLGSSVISLICREFRVSEKWLRTGEGDMFVQLSRDEEVVAFLGDIMSDDDDSFRKRMISTLSRLDVEDWALLERLARKLLED